MKPEQIITLVVCAFLIVAAKSHARVGESPEQCDQRYGKPLFQRAAGDLEYRSYKFAGHELRVGFFKAKSVTELIASGPQGILAEGGIENLSKESMKFCLGLLSGAYAFTDEQLQGLGDLKRAGELEATSVVENDSIRATYFVDMSASQDSMNFTIVVFDKTASAVAKEVSSFMGESAGLEVKHRNAEKADGF